jgi:hypothetical protein
MVRRCSCPSQRPSPRSASPAALPAPSAPASPVAGGGRGQGHLGRGGQGRGGRRQQQQQQQVQPPGVSPCIQGGLTVRQDRTGPITVSCCCSYRVKQQFKPHQSLSNHRTQPIDKGGMTAAAAAAAAAQLAAPHWVPVCVSHP